MTAAPIIEPWAVAWSKSRDNPLLYVTDVLGVLPYGQPNPDGAPQLEEWQETVLKAIRDGKKRISIRSGHGVGKTALVAWLVLWALLTHSDCKVPVAASSQDQLRDTIWPEIAKWHRALPLALKEQIDCQSERIIIKAAPDASFAVRRTASKENSEALAGFHANFLLFLIDEASGIDDVIFEVASGALSTPGAIVILTGNPTKRSGYFFDTHNSQRGRWFTIRVSSEDVPRAQGHIEDIIATYGKASNKYRVRVLGEFPTADDSTFIPLDIIESARGRDVAKLNLQPIWGVDVARFGDDTSALAKRQGNWLLEPVKEWRGKDTAQLATLIAEEYQNTDEPDRPHAIMIDAIGIGAGVVDMLKRLSVPAYGVNVAESASNDDKYFRQRDELWGKGKDWFLSKTSRIPADEKLIAELASPLFDYNVHGQIVIEPKKEMKKRGLQSPNKADAFLNTFGRPEKEIKKVQRYRDEYRGTTSWAA